MGLPHETTDHELLTRWRNSDRQAGMALFQRHVDAVTSLFRRNVRNTNDIPDLVQQTFLAVQSSTRERLPEGSIRGYLLGVAFHTMTRHFRKLRSAAESGNAGAEIEGESDDALDIASLAPDPEYVLGLSEERRLLMRAIRRLPLQYQAVLELSYWQGLSGPDTAAALEWPEGVVRSRLRLARHALEKKVAELAEVPDLLHETTMSLDSWRRNIKGWMRNRT